MLNLHVLLVKTYRVLLDLEEIDILVQTAVTWSANLADFKNVLVLVNPKLFLVLQATLRKFWISYNGITVDISNTDVEMSHSGTAY